ncbi:MAG: hypothetical protein ACI39W_04565 [Brotaphodocola sp.]
MEKNKWLQGLREAEREIRQKPLVSAVYLLLRASIIICLIAQFFNRNFENMFLCVLSLVLLLMPTVLEHKLKIDFPDTMEIIIMLFIYAAEILGEIRSFYLTYPYWDTMLHTLNGFLCAAIGFCLVDFFNRNERFSLELSPAFMAIVAFCFSMTIGVLWEFFEYTMDQFFLFDMQKDTVVNLISSVSLDPSSSNVPVVIKHITDVIVVADGQETALGLGGYLDVGLHDTMADLFVNFIGAAVFSMIGYCYVKSRGKGRFARRFIPQIVKDQENHAE